MNPAGYWVLETSVGSMVLSVAGTWDDDEGARRSHVTVVNGVVLENRIGVPAQRGDQMPGLSDLREALAAVPRDARALWTRPSSDAAELPKPVFNTPEQILRSGEIVVGGTLGQATPACCVLIDRRRLEAEDGAFAAKVRVAGDVLRTWVRAHAASGLRSGPASWMRVRADGLKPRVEPLYPAADDQVAAGSTVEVRLFVYDSNLERLEIGGQEQSLGRGEVHVIERTMTAPAQGALELPVRAVDTAGNERAITFSWPVR